MFLNSYLGVDIGDAFALLGVVTRVDSVVTVEVLSYNVVDETRIDGGMSIGPYLPYDSYQTHVG